MRSMTKALGTMLTVQVAAGASAAAAQPSGLPAGTGGQTTAVHACSVLSEADIVRATRQPNRFNIPAQRSELASGITECDYFNLSVTLTPRMTPQWFDRTWKQSETAKNVTVEPVSGVGDDAYFYVRSMRSSSNVGIIVRRGQYQVAMGDLLPADSVAWLKPKLVELAKLAVAKLR